MKKYDHRKIEAKWQKYWAKKGIYRSRENTKKPKQYILDMFPYPSGDGLHVGHPKGYIATDVYSRYSRMRGAEVLHPMGWDAFGLPAENYAIKNKVHPRKAVEKNVKRFKEQLNMIGLDYDWGREINTTDPEFYKWTQWIFLKLYEKGLAYESYEPINWCPSCQTGLANEDLEGNTCERCGSIVEKRPMRQWILKITAYADRLLEDIALLPEWQEHIKESQRNWIGKSEGVEIDFQLVGEGLKDDSHFVILHGREGSSKSVWIPWLATELRARGFDVQVPDMPNTMEPNDVEQAAYVEKNCTLDEKTVVIGHSFGGVVALRLAERMKLRRIILAATPYSGDFLDGERRASVTAAVKRGFDAGAIKSNTRTVMVLPDTADDRVPFIDAESIVRDFGAMLVRGQGSKPHFMEKREPDLLMAAIPTIRVFTTRPDTLFGATYLVLSPEHPWITLAIDAKHDVLKNKSEVAAYVKKAAQKSEVERQENKEKSGIQLEGIEAVNPANGDKIPVYVADYVLATYGTGAIMAVPAHDERDHAFAKKFNIPIREVIEPLHTQTTDVDALRDGPLVERNAVAAVVRHWEKDEYLCLSWKDQPIRAFVTGGIEDGEDPIECARREIAEETGYTEMEFVRPLGGRVHGQFFLVAKNLNRFGHYTPLLFRLTAGTRKEVAEAEKMQHEAEWISASEVGKFINRGDQLTIWGRVVREAPYTGSGILTNSGGFDGLLSDDAKKQITNAFGRSKVQYKLRDWVFSRQRYWGEPIPIIHCDPPAGGCGIVPVPEKDLPVKLPDVKNYKPTGTGESPLAAIEKWVNVKCPKCRGKAKRETNTMPQWAGSSWYYIAYCIRENLKSQVPISKQIASPKLQNKLKYWLPVDLYVGGAEHATRHLIYARFWHKFLFDIGVVTTLEPFTRLISVGLIMAEDGKKMSKRYGNVINPDDVVAAYGADSLRVYEMFMGPFTETIAWNTNSMIGARRFLERVWRLQERMGRSDLPKVEKLLHRTIKKVSEDIQAFKFNTAISSMMIFMNTAEKEGITRTQYRTFLKLLAPFAPHITEELWQTHGGPATPRLRGARKGSVHTAAWPRYDDAKLIDDMVTMVVQVNGRVRGQMQVAADISEQEASFEAAKIVPNWLEGKTIIKTVFVAGRLVNFVAA